MKTFLVLLGTILLNTPAVLATELRNEGNVCYDSDPSVISSSYSAGKFDLDGRTGVPPGRSTTSGGR